MRGYDVIVVGARCAGATTAMLQARAGRRVLVLDRHDTATDVLSTHVLRPPAVLRLAEWGLLERLVATGCPPLLTETLATPDHSLVCDLASHYGAITYAPRRRVLDPLLLDAAIESGAEFRRASVTGLIHRDGRVAGVRIGAEEIEADLVVGADGLRSTVARLAGAEEYDVRATVSCVYYSYWTDVPPNGLEGYVGEGVGVGIIPTNDGRTIITTYFPQAEFNRVRVDAQQAYLDGIFRCHPSFAERLAGARQAERLYAMADQRNFLRTPAGPGWVLVGDAGHHKDSITGWGITHAFEQAHALTELGPDEFARTRDQSLTALYDVTLEVAKLDPAGFGPLMEAAAADPALTTRVFQFLAGMLSMEELLV